MKRKTDSEIEKDQRFNQMTEDTLTFAEVMTQHLLPCSDDLTLLTLKGHLVAENLLESILIRALSIPRLPEDKDARLTFFQKLKLAEAITCARDPGPNADIFCAVAKLNSVRNRLAHNLKNSVEIESDIKSLIQTYSAKSGEKLDSSKQLPEVLRDCLCKLCVFLFQLKRHFYHVSETSDS